jgi:hypothetical protein
MTRKPIGLSVPYRKKPEPTQKRPWVGLTDEEIERLIHNFKGDPWSLLMEFETRLKEKNGG